jgi:RHS repeat-associated protein
MTYPSGRTVTYTFDTLGRVSGVSTTPPGGSAQTLASGITYQPFGGVKGLTFGNAQTYARGYDQDGRIVSYTLGAQTFAIGYDDAGRIEFISETGNPPNTNTYVYDDLDRLTGAITPSTPFAYTYDPVGNRLTRTVGSGTETLTYSLTSNRIATLTPASGPARSFTLDANGSTTDDDLNTYAYDVRGRMVSATSSLGTTTYQINALGQRVRKTSTSGDHVFHYGRAGHLVAESSAAGAVVKEYVWLGDLPLAVIDSTGRYYIHVDHLNTPRLVANAAGTTVWRWEQSEPFGTNAPDENPSGLGVFDMPLRLQGQYFDRETNLHHNYHRDYDPNLGRYGQSDPIGLRGGTNTYAYVKSTPISSFDRRGLQSSDLSGDTGNRVPWGWSDIIAQRQRDTARQLQKAWNRLFNESADDNDASANPAGENGAQGLPDQTGKPRSETERDLASQGFRPAAPVGSYDEYVHPDGSRVLIGPDGRIVRIGPKVAGKKYGKRYGPNGEEIPYEPGKNTHDTGERCIPGQ